MYITQITQAGDLLDISPSSCQTCRYRSPYLPHIGRLLRYVKHTGRKTLQFFVVHPPHDDRPANSPPGGSV